MRNALIVLLALGLRLATCRLTPLAAPSKPQVVVYASEDGGVLDLSWDKSVEHLAAQLREFAEVSLATTGQPTLDGKVKTFVIPAQSGSIPYATAEDTAQLQAYVKAGGLVVIMDSLDAASDASGQKALIESLLGYQQGGWQQCEMLFQSDTMGPGLADKQPTVYEHARNFLVDSSASTWPANLEHEPGVLVHSLCLHEDPSFATWPLYVVADEERTDAAVAAQAFGRLGVRGAVIWLGYAWRAGPQPGWGALLHKCITEFSQGKFQSPKGASTFSWQLGTKYVTDVMRRVMVGAEELAESVLQQAPHARLLQQGTAGAGVYSPTVTAASSPAANPTASPAANPTASPAANPIPSPELQETVVPAVDAIIAQNWTTTLSVEEIVSAISTVSATLVEVVNAVNNSQTALLALSNTSSPQVIITAMAESITNASEIIVKLNATELGVDPAKFSELLSFANSTASLNISSSVNASSLQRPLKLVADALGQLAALTAQRDIELNKFAGGSTADQILRVIMDAIGAVVRELARLTEGIKLLAAGTITEAQFEQLYATSPSINGTSSDASNSFSSPVPSPTVG